MYFLVLLFINNNLLKSDKMSTNLATMAVRRAKTEQTDKSYPMNRMKFIGRFVCVFGFFLAVIIAIDLS